MIASVSRAVGAVGMILAARAIPEMQIANRIQKKSRVHPSMNGEIPRTVIATTPLVGGCGRTRTREAIAV